MRSNECTVPEVKAFLKHYKIGDQINYFLLSAKEQVKAVKTGMVRLEFIDNDVIWKRK